MAYEPNQPRKIKPYTINDILNRINDSFLQIDNVKITTFSGFVTLLTEQIGQVAHSYWHEGRESPSIPSDLSDVIVCCLRAMKWCNLSHVEIIDEIYNGIEKAKLSMKIRMNEDDCEK